MANLKDLRNRIASVQSTQKITKAMKMVAASKLRRAQEAAEAARPYAERMELVLGSLAASMKGQAGGPKLLAGTGSDTVQLVVVATSERGLCGGFNTNIVKAARIKIASLLADGKDVKIVTIGKKGRSALRRDFGSRMIEHFDMSHVKNLGYGDVSPIAERILEMFDAGEFDVCTLFYAKFQSALVQIVTGQQLIPASFDEENTADLGGAAYDYEPDEKDILEELLPRNVGIQMFRGLLENAASEQGSRMTAMDSSTRNAGDMIDKLRTTYNRSRQAVITNELIEIISGAEAL
ncbi:F0F1 ATP synthase subunit gamma [Emcibacter sp.]|uniref:F0F1 ATP synthase subunit gamma n=1 Tax=Emcibacter sp. TaxID=1979954 RepID=UPI002AA6AFA1|nr:F0F1 ATP synthase subunit gamma [Emcibacter sp.]